MLQRDIASRQNKFEREATAKAKEEKRKRELAQSKEARIRKQQEELEIKRKQKILEERRRQEVEQLRIEQAREFNRGTFLEKVLNPTPLPEEASISLGIKRWIDKVRLPASMSNELMEQGASRNGALMFRLTEENGNHTHVGVLDFSAAEDTICLPPHVIRCLWNSDTCQGKLTVEYRRLLKGTFARLQPLKRGFHEAVGDQLKIVLEDRLRQQSALTEGDVLQVCLPDSDLVYDLKVVELEPSSAISILDTDLEVDVIPSEELETMIKKQMEAQQFEPLSSAPSSLSRISQQQLQANTKISPDFKQRATEEELPAEVSANENNILSCAIRLPDGVQLQRRFQLGDVIAQLFQFVRVKASGHICGEFSLVTRFPHRELLESQDARRTFQEYGFTQQQLFFVKL